VAIVAAATVAAGAVAWRSLAPTPTGRGLDSYRRGDWRGAAEIARGQLKARPGDREALRLLARSSARLGRDELALGLYRRLGTEAMQAEDLFLLGHGLLRGGQEGPALVALGAALDADPDHVEALRELAIYHQSGGDLLVAAGLYDRLAAQPGWEVWGEAGLGRVRHDIRDPEGAVEALEGVLRRDKAPFRADEPAGRALRKLLARALLECGRPAEALDALQSVPARRDDSEAAWLASRALLRAGRVAEAREALTEARGYGRSDPLRPEPAPYVGAARCAECHEEIVQTQQASRHARTIQKADDPDFVPLPAEDLPDSANPSVRHTLRRVGGRIVAEARVGDDVQTALVEFAIGSGHQGTSLLARDRRGGSRELRISYYPDTGRWDRTIDHPDVPPDAEGYLGRPVVDDAARKCLDCHATDARAAREPGLPESSDRGIGCERCHGPGGNHLLAVEADFPDLAIARPRLATAEQSLALCEQCHRAPRSGLDPSDPKRIRFQAPSLARSRCYRESEGGMSCTTCHDPHADARGDAAYYEARCLRCHASSGRGSGPGEGPSRTPRASTCTVNPEKDCLACHMPRVTDAVPHSTFTDHWVRVRREDRRPDPR
jgi:tetratricopeptide (TPR) repeat protein